MNSKKTVPVFFSIALVGAWVLAGSLASAAESSLRFHGGLVNAGCEAMVLGATQRTEAVKAMNVSSTVKLGLVSHDDACGTTAVPISTAYVERSSVATSGRNGVVTLTYQ